MDKVNKLTSTFAIVWEEFEYVSLRMWKEGGEVCFFISNLLSRNLKGSKIDRPTTSSMPRPDTESTQEIPNKHPAAPTQQTRGQPVRKKQKTTPARTPEIQRNNSVAEISFEEYERNLSLVSNPYLNSFQALADQDTRNPDQDYDTQNFTKDSI